MSPSSKRVVVMSDDEESDDYDKSNVTYNTLENDFQVRASCGVRPIRTHSPESTTEQANHPLPSEKPKRTYRKKTSKEKEEAKQDRERKRSQKKESVSLESNKVDSLSYIRLLEENNRTIRELLAKVNAYEQVLTEMGHNPIQLLKTRSL